jgi:hypothetical protein
MRHNGNLCASPSKAFLVLTLVEVMFELTPLAGAVAVELVSLSAAACVLVVDGVRSGAVGWSGVALSRASVGVDTLSPRLIT